MEEEEKDKRFLVFAYAEYDANGGVTDIIDSFDSVSEAIELINKHNTENGGYNYDVYDRVEGLGVDFELD